MVGRNLGSYRVVEKMQSGGRAPIYKGYDPSMDRYVCIKVLPEHLSGDPFTRKRFLINARALARLEHVHILPVDNYGEDHNVPYIVMQYLTTGNLADVMQHGPLSLDEVARILNQIGQALDHAHRLGILHQDMKPSNVLVDSYRNIFLMDFGISTLIGTNMVLDGDSNPGMLAYVSPEQSRGIMELGPATDIYSLGIILFEMLTGQRPFPAETLLALIRQQMNEPIPSLRDLRSELPEAVERVVHQAMAKEPADRFDTAGAFVDAFASSI